MPGPRMGGRGRSAIYDWRVKAGKRQVYSNPVKMKCKEFIRDNGGKLNGLRLKLIPPNI